jgi:hypothetical protein
VFVVPLVVGVPLGLLTVTLADCDLTPMASGAMDPGGREEAVGGALGRRRA